MPSGPGVIVGVDGQWIRLKPGFGPLPYPAQRLDRPRRSEQTGSLSGWALHSISEHEPYLNQPPEQAQLPARASVEPDQDPRPQWGMQPDQAA